MDDYRVLLLAPTRRDREATLELLRRAGIEANPYEGARMLAAEIETSVGAILMTDAAFIDPHIDQVLAALSRQPPWSDVPIVLLCHSGTPPPSTNRVLNSLRNVTLLERPSSSRTLLSSIQAAIRARARQYQLRDQFEALRTTGAALREADQRKDIFLATLAHELRNPLAPIRTAAQVLASPKLAPQQLQWVQNVIQRQVGQMALLLDDLLDIARITQGKLELKKTRVTLTDVVDSAVEAARPLIDGKHHELTITLPPEDLAFEADPLRLSQVLCNLLTNAAKYTDPAGHIELSGSLQNETLCLSVKDDGIGIEPHALARIFQMFSQIDGTSTRSESGLGIGLALVKGLLELHGGTIEAHSHGSGQGSEFCVRLPLGTPEFRERQKTDVDAPPVGPPARRVMIADDNKDAADALGMLLDLAAHEIRVAYSGRSALTLARTFRPDVAFIDIGMPDLSGYEVARELRREPWGAGICLVALTGWGQDDDRQRAKHAGFDQHMTKPVDPDALERLLAEPSFSARRID
jgi:signal transduction histidine kinase/CheY-like chemotaxis protein